MAHRDLPSFPTRRSSDLQELLSFAEGTAGRIMTPDVFALSEDLTVSESISAIQRASRDVELVYYLYVVDDRTHLVGVSSLRSEDHTSELQSQFHLVCRPL